MANFVQSMEPLQGSSNLIRNHYRLFHVLYSIGRRYTELRATVNAPQPEGVELKSAMDGYLSELGYQPELWTAMGNELSPGSMAVGEATSTEVCMDDASAFFDGEQDHSSGMANWLCLSQQMMGLLDKEDFVL
jgi:hypothetical protein